MPKQRHELQNAQQGYNNDDDVAVWVKYHGYVESGPVLEGKSIFFTDNGYNFQIEAAFFRQIEVWSDGDVLIHLMPLKF